MKRNEKIRRLDRLAGRYFIKYSMYLVKWLPECLLYPFSRFMGYLGFWAVPKYRKITLNNLSESFKEKTPSEIRKIAIESYCEITWGAVEIIKLALDKNVHQKLRDLVDIEGAEYLDNELKKGKGLICISAHFGNFTIMTTRLTLQGYPFNLVMRFADDEAVAEMWKDVMRNVGIKAISARPRRKAVVESLRWLRENKPLCLHSDQNKTNGVYVDLFGRPAGTVEGPARLHLRTGAPIVCGFIVREDLHHHKIIITPPLDIKLTGDDEKDIFNITQAFTKVIEKFVRKYPQQWWWMHDRWKGARRLNKLSS
jgi:KDO2-lipid IV(A) lauroyltransferase